MENICNSSKLLEELMDMYTELDFENPDEVVRFIHKMIISQEFVSEKVGKAIAKDLNEKGIKGYKEYEKEHDYMDRYNHTYQYYFLSDDKKEIAGNLLSRYKTSLEFLGKPNIYIKYLKLIYRTRFIDCPNKDKIEALKTTPTFDEYIKYYK